MDEIGIRPLSAADVEPAATLLDRGDWGPYEARRAFFAFAVETPACAPIAAEAGGAIVGTGVGTANGPTGWVGTIFVDGPARGRGLGRRLTEVVIDDLEARGCETLVLVATDLGRPVYERLGFADDGWYLVHEAPGLEPDGGARAAALGPADVAEMAVLDRAATGEDRGPVLAALVAAGPPAGAFGIRSEAGGLDAFVLRPPWGGGATIVRDLDAARAILDVRRRSAGPERRVRAGVHSSNDAGLALLRAAGWTEAWRARRMVRGRPLEWRPERIWGQLNFALG
jgi:ribosomal protein S18 acetylase RimI-like enzyme